MIRNISESPSVGSRTTRLVVAWLAGVDDRFAGVLIRRASGPAGPPASETSTTGIHDAATSFLCCAQPAAGGAGDGDLSGKNSVLLATSGLTSRTILPPGGVNCLLSSPASVLADALDGQQPPEVTAVGPIHAPILIPGWVPFARRLPGLCRIRVRSSG